MTLFERVALAVSGDHCEVLGCHVRYTKGLVDRVNGRAMLIHTPPNAGSPDASTLVDNETSAYALGGWLRDLHRRHGLT